MVHTMARVEVADFDIWLRVHRANAENRRAFGIIDGPIYRDIDEPNAVLVHTSTDDPSRAAQWFQTEAFKEATGALGGLDQVLAAFRAAAALICLGGWLHRVPA